jgi:ketosteroid isomerase-like protein
MGQSVSLRLVQTFYEAYARRDLAAVLEFLSDDVEWKYLGPVEVFPFCGFRRGKAAVVDHFTRHVPARFAFKRMEPEELVVDGDRAASFSKITAVENGSGRVLTYHCAHFITFRDGKVTAVQAVADTFGMIEQLQDFELSFDQPDLAEPVCHAEPDLQGLARTPAVCAAGCEQQPCLSAIRNAAPEMVANFYEAYVSCDPQRLDAVLHDDVTWLISGPADQIDFFGMRHGKAEVIELITRVIPCFQRLAGFEIEHLLVQGDRAATFGRVCAHRRETNRSLRFAYAHFLRFQDGKLLSMRSLTDSFDAVEQLTGCRITIRAGAGLAPMLGDDDLAAV